MYLVHVCANSKKAGFLFECKLGKAMEKKINMHVQYVEIVQLISSVYAFTGNSVLVYVFVCILDFTKLVLNQFVWPNR
jgi:hypothetical protein